MGAEKFSSNFFPCEQSRTWLLCKVAFFFAVCMAILLPKKVALNFGIFQSFCCCRVRDNSKFESEFNPLCNLRLGSQSDATTEALRKSLWLSSFFWGGGECCKIRYKMRQIEVCALSPPLSSWCIRRLRRLLLLLLKRGAIFISLLSGGRRKGLSPDSWQTVTNAGVTQRGVGGTKMD